MGTYSCSVKSIEDLRRKGANYFVTTAMDEIDGSVLDYLKSKCEAIQSTNEYLIVKL